MSTATSGRAREYKVRDHLASHGWVPIMRAAASKGAGDLFMGHPERGGALIQVGTANKSLGPADRERFVTAADLTGALPILASVVHRPGKPNRIDYWQVSRDVPSKWEPWTP